MQKSKFRVCFEVHILVHIIEALETPLNLIKILQTLIFSELNLSVYSTG